MVIRLQLGRFEVAACTTLPASTSSARAWRGPGFCRWVADTPAIFTASLFRRLYIEALRGENGILFFAQPSAPGEIRWGASWKP